jgi:hypothetical protein
MILQNLTSTIAVFISSLQSLDVLPAIFTGTTHDYIRVLRCLLQYVVTHICK